MALDAQTIAMLEGMNAAGGPKLSELSIGDARAALAALAGDSASVTGFAGSCENRTISGPGGAIPLRLYWPEKTGETLLPVLVFFHGGGFALGNLDSHDAICRQLCIRANVIVVNVDYRQPPEHRFPAAPQDCYAALQWTAENAAALGGDKARIAVAGDSAGANLAAVVSLMAKERNGPALAYQILCYPVTHLDPHYETRSRKAFGGGDYFLADADMHWIAGMYLSDPADAQNPFASPLLARDLSGLPAALVITAGYDMLRDEGEDYARRLRAAGVETEYVEFEGTIHGFIAFNDLLDSGKEALALIAGRLKEKLG
jgi:acetyl esterase